MANKKPSIQINPSKMDFVYGNCAVLAIANAFGLNRLAIKTICILMKLDYTEGLSFWECKKLIHKLAKNGGSEVTYYRNSARLEYWQLSVVLNRGRYLPIFDMHLSYMENGVIYDTYLYDLQKTHLGKDQLTKIALGWWRID